MSEATGSVGEGLRPAAAAPGRDGPEEPDNEENPLRPPSECSFESDDEFVPWSSDDDFDEGGDTPSKFEKPHPKAGRQHPGRRMRFTELEWASHRAEEAGLGAEILNVNQHAGAVEDGAIKKTSPDLRRDV